MVPHLDYHSALAASSFSRGAVVVVSDRSRSEAHKAAPTVFVKAKKMPTTGMSSRRRATTPKLKRHWWSARNKADG